MTIASTAATAPSLCSCRSSSGGVGNHPKKNTVWFWKEWTNLFFAWVVDCEDLRVYGILLPLRHVSPAPYHYGLTTGTASP